MADHKTEAAPSRPKNLGKIIVRAATPDDDDLEAPKQTIKVVSPNSVKLKSASFTLPAKDGKEEKKEGEKKEKKEAAQDTTKGVKFRVLAIDGGGSK